MTTAADARSLAVVLASRMVGNLYSWGGESLQEGGFDCSGFVGEVLTQTAAAWPQLYDGRRRTARGLYLHFKEHGVPDITRVGDLLPGAVVFYRRPGKPIHHVAFHVATVPAVRLEDGANEVGPLAFEAGGSGSKATTPRAALLASAGVRMSASDYHGQGVEWVGKDPFSLIAG